MSTSTKPATNEAPPARSKEPWYERWSEAIVLAIVLVPFLAAMYACSAMQAPAEIDHEWQEIEAP